MRALPRTASRAAFLLVALASGVSGADYEALETRQLRLIYRGVVHEILAPHTARCFENAMRFYSDVFRYVPHEKVTVILDDAYDFNNGAAFAAPRNTILVQIAPANTVYETLPSNERINHTMNHELAHVVALDGASGSDRLFRRLFCGKVGANPEQPETIVYEFLTSPRFASPRWYHEGVASFLETWMAGGIGRAQGAYDEMVFRSMVRDGARFYDPVGLESEGTKVEFEAGALSYLYGTRFVTYLAHEHSPQAVIEWASRTDGSKPYWARQFQKVFGMPVETAWRQWIEWEQRFQQANLDSIRREPRTPVVDLSATALGSVSRAYVDRSGDKLYVGASLPGVIGRIAALSLRDGSLEPICDIKGPALYFVTSLAYDARGDTLFYTGDNSSWRDLWVVDPKRGEPERLMRDARIGDLVHDSTRDCLWGIRHFNGISTLVRIPRPWRRWWQVYSWPYGQDVYDIDLSADGRWLSFSMSEIDGRQSLQLAEVGALEGGDGRSRELYDFGASLPANFVFSEDGRHLYGSSYYTGVSNIWRYDLGDSTMQVVSNCETGLFRPLPLAGDALVVFRYSGAGFVPATMHARPLDEVSATTFLGQQVAATHPVVTGWNIGSPARVPLDSLTVYDGEYSNLGSIGLASVHPIVQGYKEYTAIGLRFDLSDPGFWNAAHLAVSYTPGGSLDDDERLHAGGAFRHLGWEFFARYNHADFYDLFGPTKRSRKGEVVGLRWEKRLVDDRPRQLDLEMHTAGHFDLETLPGAQNVAASAREVWSTAALLRYRDLRRSLGAVDDEKGWRWNAGGQLDAARSDLFTTLWAGLEFGHPVLFRHGSLWLRSHAGWSPGPRDEPFANFYFGGFGNNWVDRLDEKRYRELEAFPGAELNEISGTNFVKSMLEWNVPPWRFRRAGKPSFYLTWARPALFVAGIVTNVDRDAARIEAGSAGGQVDVRFTLLSRLSMTLSVGWASAFRDGAKPRDEFMLSLKVL